MTKTEKRIWVRKVKEHIDVRLKEACREAVRVYWPASDTYDPDAPKEGNAIYEKFKKALRKAMKEVGL